MFRIVLQPEEDALLCAVRDQPHALGMIPSHVFLRLMALRMLRCDEHGRPVLTDLAEAALARMRRKIH